MSDGSRHHGPPEGADGAEEVQARRRRRTAAYLSMWGVTADISALPAPTASDAQPIDAVIGRAKALCLCALKGQGLSQHETFAFADAYEVWDHLSLVENDFVLDPAPERHDLVQNAWRFEGLWVLEWALGLVRHLAFPDVSADPATATQLCVASVCAASDEGRVLAIRPVKELLDGADVSLALQAVCSAARASSLPMPGGLHDGVVHERRSAFAWLVQ